MRVSVIGIILNVFMIVLIIVYFIIYDIYNNQLNNCETRQSLFCPRILCPCDNPALGPCFGTAIQPGPKEGQYYCSNNIPTTAGKTFPTLVNAAGTPI